MERNRLNGVKVELLKETELLEQVLDNAQVAIVIADNDLTIERINPEFTRMFGYDEEEAIGESIHDLIVPDADRLRVEAEEVLDRLMKGENLEFETMRRKKDGKIIHVLNRTSPIIINK